MNNVIEMEVKKRDILLWLGARRVVEVLYSDYNQETDIYEINNYDNLDCESRCDSANAVVGQQLKNPVLFLGTNYLNSGEVSDSDLKIEEEKFRKEAKRICEKPINIQYPNEIVDKTVTENPVMLYMGEIGDHYYCVWFDTTASGCLWKFNKGIFRNDFISFQYYVLNDINEALFIEVEDNYTINWSDII